MNMNEYQALARRTAGQASITIWALGVAGEAGEVADYIKKVVGHGHPMDREKLTKELGDVLWYIAALAAEINVTLDEVAQMNVDKLRARYPDGFDSKRSMERTE